MLRAWSSPTALGLAVSVVLLLALPTTAQEWNPTPQPNDPDASGLPPEIIGSILLLGAGVTALPALSSYRLRRSRTHVERMEMNHARVQKRLGAARRLDKRGHWRRALLHTRLALRVDSGNLEVLELQGKCHQWLNQHRRAARCYERMYRILHDEQVNPRLAGRYAYLVARAHARQGNADQCMSWLRIAGHNDINVLAQALLEPDFFRVRDHEDFRRLEGESDDPWND